MTAPHVLRTFARWMGPYRPTFPPGRSVPGRSARLLRGSPDRWCRAALDLLLPPVCVDCGEGLEEPVVQPHLCADCTESLCLDATADTCLGCGLPRKKDLPKRVACLECQHRRYRFDRAVALGLYRGRLRQAVIRMKRFHEFPLTAAVASLLADRLEIRLGGDLPQVIVPIPKFWVKRVWQGTNTSEVLAETLGQRLRRPLALSALRCRKSTRKQSLLGRSERKRNLAGALQLAKGYDFDKADVLIVDDIMTTGATASEAARVFSRAGARRVTVAVVARAANGRDFPPENLHPVG